MLLNVQKVNVIMFWTFLPQTKAKLGIICDPGPQNQSRVNFLQMRFINHLKSE